MLSYTILYVYLSEIYIIPDVFHLLSSDYTLNAHV